MTTFQAPPNGSTPTPPLVQQITKRTGFLKSLLTSGNDDASRYVLKTIQQIESLVHLMHEEEQPSIPVADFKGERDTLINLITKIRASLDLDTTLSVTVNEIRTLFTADRVVVYRFNEQFDGTVVAESVGHGWTASLGMPIIDSCFRENKAAQYLNSRIFAANNIYEAGLTPCHIQLLERFQIKANLVVPIVLSDEVWGLLILHQCSGPRNWSELETNLLYQISSQLTIALQQSESLAEVQVRAKIERDKLVNVISKIRSSLDLEATLNTAVTEVRALIEADRVVVYKFDEQFIGTVIAESVLPGWTRSLGLPIVDTCFSETKAAQYALGRIVPTTDIYQAGLTPCHIQMLERFQVKSNLVIPIVQGQKVWGLLIAHQCLSIRQWQESEINLLYQVSTQLTVAIQQVEFVIQQQQKSREERDKLLSVVDKVRRASDIDDIFNTATLEVRQLLKCDRVGLFKFEEDFSGAFVSESVAKGWRPLIGTERARVADSYLTKNQGGRYSRNESHIVSDIYQTGFDSCHIDLLEQFQARAYVIVPVFKEQKLWGLFAAYQNDGPRSWEESEVNLLYQIANQLTIGIGQSEAALLQQQQAKAERDQLLLITSKIRESLDLPTIFNSTVTEVQRAVSADRVVVYKFDEEYIGTVVAESVLMGWTKSLGLPIIDTCFKDSRGSGISGYDTGRIISTPDVTQAGLTPCHLKMLQRFEVKANLVVPIVQGAKVWGLLIAHQCTTPRNWQESEINLFYQVSTQLTVAIQQAEFVIQQQQKGREERDNLLAVVDKVRRAATLADIFRTVTQEVRQLLKCDRVGLFKFAEDFSGEFVSESVAKGWRPLVGTERAQVADTYLAQNQGGRYSRNESHIVTDIYQTGFDSCHIDLLEQFQARAYIIVPVFKEQKLWGLFAAYQNDGPRSWEESEVNLLYQIAIQFTVSLQVNESLQQAQLLAEAARQQELAKQQELLQQQEFARQQREAKEFIQQRALDLMLEVDPVSKGDLTVRARVTNDEIGTIADSYNATIGSLRKIVTQVQVAAQQVVQTTTGGSTQVESLSQEALAQAQTLSETVSLVARVALSIEEVAASARKAELAVQQSTLTLKVGDQAMDRTVNGILIIRETVAETAKKIKRLSESSQKISKVVSLIANFAAQTNLLALNAAIEAARAGEYGRGFAVVADEVRSLARQSAQATAEIEKLVEGIQAETKEVALAMELGTEQVVNGTRLVGETRQNLTQIAASSNEISSLVQAIAQAAYGQTQASQEITQAIRTVATGAQQTSVESIQTAAVFKELLAVAQELQVSVGKFKVG